jgi:HNH endonuclease
MGTSGCAVGGVSVVVVDETGSVGDGSAVPGIGEGFDETGGVGDGSAVPGIGEGFDAMGGVGDGIAVPGIGEGVDDGGGAQGVADGSAVQGVADGGGADGSGANDTSAWQRAHQALSRLARRRAALDAEEGRCLLAALRAAAHVHLGFASFAEYAGRLLGYSARSTREKVRVAEALEGLPALTRALEQGHVSWSAVRELTRVVTDETEAEWLEFARGKTVRQLEEVVASAQPGDAPSSPRVPRVRRHVLRFEVAPETLAAFREASTRLRRSSDAAFDDDALLLAMARAVLGGPVEAGRSSYQVALSICPQCGRGAQRAGGELVPVGPEIVDMANCDAQHIGTVIPPANDNPSVSSADEELAAATEGAGTDGPTCAHPAHHAHAAHHEHYELHDEVEDDTTITAPAAESARRCGSSRTAHVGVGLGIEQTEVDAHAQASVRRNPTDPPCSAPIDAHVGAGAEQTAEQTEVNANAERVDSPMGARAKQTIPPALRRAVLHRDQHRCRVPGCRNSTFLDIHHVQPRSKGGRNVAANLLTLCGAHHRAVHRGDLIVDLAADGFRFGHADGRAYGHLEPPTAIDIYAKVASALRHLGFRAADVRAVLASLRAKAAGVVATDETSPRVPTAEQLLREALFQLGSRR